MLKQPKGLIAAALANTGERFGFYTMMAILTLFLMSKFGIDGEQAGKIYSFFYTSIYILAFVGGLIADRLRNYKGTIIAGILVMTAGYAALMVPTVTSKTVVIGALMVIAFGNGLFKGNLQALVGQLYDNEQYAKLRDTGFQIFYMFINIKKYGMDSLTFCEKMLKEGLVGLIPGVYFGTEGYMRLSYCYSDEDLNEGLNRVDRFLKTL